MARLYPADVRLQNFYTEQFGKESGARLKAFSDNKRGMVNSADASWSKYIHGLPPIIPQQFARQQKLKEEAEMTRLVAEARGKQKMEEMHPVSKKELAPLYDGFSKEGKGRSQYLRQRKTAIPEKKYEFPFVSSWDYGWKLDEQFKLQKPKFARTCLINDTFYTRNGVPTLDDPTQGHRFDGRSHTIIF